MTDRDREVLLNKIQIAEKALEQMKLCLVPTDKPVHKNNFKFWLSKLKNVFSVKEINQMFKSKELSQDEKG